MSLISILPLISITGKRKFWESAAAEHSKQRQRRADRKEEKIYITCSSVPVSDGRWMIKALETLSQQLFSLRQEEGTPVLTERFGANPLVSSLVCRGTRPWSGEAGSTKADSLMQQRSQALTYKQHQHTGLDVKEGGLGGHRKSKPGRTVPFISLKQALFQVLLMLKMCQRSSKFFKNNRKQNIINSII